MIEIIPKPKSIKYFEGVFNYTNKIEKVVDSRIAKEGYELRINSKGVQFKASTESGFFYAKQTLNQIVFQVGNYLPYIEIIDAPRFEHRGFMIDGVRHFVRIEHIKKIIDIASSLKMNKFHFHLSDDQGFGFEVPSLDKLVKVGSIRNGSHFGHIEKDTNIYCAYYTHMELKDLVQYCKARNIEIIPEVDVPGHTSALLAAYPEFSCRGENVEVKTTAGIYKDIICAGNDDAMDAICKILDEIESIFETDTVHLGGDETPMNRWKSCPKCQSKMKLLGLKNEMQLKGHMLNTLDEYVQMKGRRSIAWNESLDGDNLNSDITIQYWMDKRNKCKDWTKSGNKIVNSNFFHYYMDYPLGFTPLKKTYNYDPCNRFGEDAILGVEAPIWTEHVKDFNRMCYLLFPRLIAVAESAWSQENRKDYKNFERRLKTLIPYILRGVNYAPKEDWNMNIFRRLYDTFSFFHRTLTKEVISGFIKN